MPFLKHRSIKTKLTVLAATSGALALLLAGTAFMANDWRLMRTAKVAQLRTQAELLAYNSSAAVLLRDQDAAAHWLKGAGGTTGFNDLTEAARALEQAAKSCNAEATARALNVLDRLAARIEMPQPF